MAKKHSVRFGFILVLLIVSVVQQVKAADWFYTMRPGDTLWTLCKEYSKEPGCWQKLGPLNNIARDRAIPPGTRIRMPADWLKVPAASATVAFTQGEVQYQLPGEALLPATEGIKLTVGSKLITAQGSVSLQFADGSRLVLEPNSQLELDTLSNFELHGMVDSTVRLNRGTVKTRVIKREPKSRFRTITPSAVAAVRGTEYRVNVIEENQQAQAKASTLVEVYKGLVDVGAEHTTFPVPASFGIVAKQGEKLQEPVKLLDKPEFMAFEEQQILFVDESGKHFLPILINWQTMPLAVSYQLNVLADTKDLSSTENLLKRYQINSTQVNVNDLEVGCYWLSLRAIDGLGLHGLAAQKRLCLNPQIATPEPRVLEQDVANGSQVLISWQKVNDAQKYRIEVSEVADFSSIFSSEETSALSYRVTKQSSDLFVRIQALGDGGNYSSHSNTVNIQALEVEEKPFWPVFIPIGLFLLAIL